MSCTKTPNTKITDFNRILVIGDLHADYDMTLQLFKKFNIINNNKKWIGGDTYVVQLGDQVDGKGRGHDDAEGEQQVLDLLDDLNIQAEAYQGGVFSLIGNHELMNVQGDFRYASNSDISSDGGEEARLKKYTPGGILAKRLACSRNVILKIDDIIFVHAGISKELSEDIRNNNIELINTTMRDFFLNKIDSNNKNVQKYLLNNKGLLWDRSLGKSENSEVCSRINYLNIGHIIVGHTPQKNINSICGNKIWRTDIGLSKAMGNNHFQILEIVKNKDGSKKFNVLQ
jgi:hypothetical protein